MAKGDYAAKYKDARWQKKRLEVLTDADWTCEMCGVKSQENGAEMHVHHKFYWFTRRAAPWDYERKHLMALCSTCHEKMPRGNEAWESLIAGFCGEGVSRPSELRALVDVSISVLRALHDSWEDDGASESFRDCLLAVCQSAIDARGDQFRPHDRVGVPVVTSDDRPARAVRLDRAAIEQEMLRFVLRDDSGHAAERWLELRGELPCETPLASMLQSEIESWECSRANGNADDCSPAEYVKGRFDIFAEEFGGDYVRFVTELLSSDLVPDKTDFVRAVQDGHHRLMEDLERQRRRSAARVNRHRDVVS